MRTLGPTPAARHILTLWLLLPAACGGIASGGDSIDASAQASQVAPAATGSASGAVSSSAPAGVNSTPSASSEPNSPTSVPPIASSTEPNQVTAGGNTVVAPRAASTPNFLMGILPDYDNAATGGIAGFIKRTNVTPTAASGYVNVGPNGSIETETGIGYIKEAVANKLPIVSLSMTAKQAGSLTNDQVAGVQQMVVAAQAAGIELWLRYGYEMNFGGGDGQFANINENNNPKDFLAQWAQVAAVANPLRKAAHPVRMFWSPNIQSGGDLPYASWLPSDVGTIDLVGVDYYHQASAAISSAAILSDVASVYAIAKQAGVPFLFGETGIITGSSDAGEAQTKIDWLTALSSPALRNGMPLYQGFFYFDYEKGGTNFSISQDNFAVPLFQAFYRSTFNGTAGS